MQHLYELLSGQKAEAWNYVASPSSFCTPPHDVCVSRCFSWEGGSFVCVLFCFEMRRKYAP